MSSAEDLMQVYEMALQNDPQLLAESASRQAVAELSEQAKARFLPEVGLTANTTQTWNDTSSSTTARNFDYNSYGYSLSLTQPLYRRQNTIQKEQASIAIDSAAASYKIIEQDLIIRVAERYFDFLSRQDEVTFAIAEHESIAQQLDQTQQRFDVGMSTITDVVESQAAFDLANARVISAENELANSKERLRETAGTYIESLEKLIDESPLVRPEPEDINAWSEIALKQNPSLVVAKSSVDNAGQTIELQKSGHYPSLDLVGQADYNSQNDSVIGGSSDSQRESISLRFTLPIYEGGAVNSRTRESGHRLNQAMHNEEQQRRLIIRQSRESYNSVISGISRVEALKQAVKSNEKALESTEAGYEVGTRTTVDVLNVRSLLFGGLRDYASSRYDYILASLRLKQAAGTLSVNDLQYINQWLEQ
ncbi:TolC family outer membrane protein [Pseudomonadota bacterium]|nr:TolC family outer membrane protein [Pseudomonadota bacterium]